MADSPFTDHELTPPAKVAANAKKGVELHNQHGKGGTEVGLKRARDLGDRKPITEDDVKHIHSYFARHAVDKRPDWDSEDDPTPGYIAWMLWGGEEGKTWIDKLHKKLES